MIQATAALGLNVDGSTTLYHWTAYNTLSFNTWQHFLVTWDGSTTATNIKIYKNGTEVTYFDNGVNGISLLSVSGGTHNIGNRGNLNRGFDGIITDFAIWDKVLTSTQASTLGTSWMRGVPLTIESSNLQVYFPMNDGILGASADGATIYDRSGNGRNGTGDNGANNTGLTWNGNLNSYSEATIKTQGSYSLKGVANITNSLNKKLVKTF